MCWDMFFSCALLGCDIVQFLLISRFAVFSISALPISHGSRLWAPYRAGNCQSTSWTNWKKHCLGFVWISNISLEEKINSQILYLTIRKIITELENLFAQYNTYLRADISLQCEMSLWQSWWQVRQSWLIRPCYSDASHVHWLHTGIKSKN